MLRILLLIAALLLSFAVSILLYDSMGPFSWFISFPAAFLLGAGANALASTFEEEY